MVKKIPRRNFVSHRPPGRAAPSIGITLPATYIDDELSRARTQIAKASVNLAQLLNSIKWQ
ncbi:MAG TPA: hypothetical protein VFA21_10540 [Pyrinomonadaceae bacterium]|jgi:hypothetical protein|nr:hypothetical protein [Pyrinomonadaceae bacterium]